MSAGSLSPGMLRWTRSWRLPLRGLGPCSLSFCRVPVAPSSSGRSGAEPRSVKGATWEAVRRSSPVSPAAAAPPPPSAPAPAPAAPRNPFPSRLRPLHRPRASLQVGAAFLQASGRRGGAPGPGVPARALRLQDQLQLHRQGPRPADRPKGELPGEAGPRGGVVRPQAGVGKGTEAAGHTGALGVDPGPSRACPHPVLHV